MKLVMLLLVRNEVDIISANMTYHLDRGVDFIVAVDNGSIDGTRDILEDFARQGVAKVIDEPGRDYNQTKWTTNAAGLAREQLKADWILSNDADEFWTAPDGDLKGELSNTGAHLLVCNRLNMVCPWDWPDRGSWRDRLIYRVKDPVRRSPPTNIHSDPLDQPVLYWALPPKVLMRAEGLQTIRQGNHAALYDRPVATAPSGIRIFHFPVRSRDQFIQKIVQGGQAYEANTEFPEEVGWHWRRWYRMYRQKGIEPVLSEVMPSGAALQEDLRSGVAVLDDRFRQLGVVD